MENYELQTGRQLTLRCKRGGGRDWLLYRFEFAGKFNNRIKKYKFRQETNHAVLLDTNEMIDQRINDIHQNPVRALIVTHPHEYMFSSALDYSGERAMSMFSVKYEPIALKTLNSLPLVANEGQ